MPRGTASSQWGATARAASSAENARQEACESVKNMHKCVHRNTVSILFSNRERSKEDRCEWSRSRRRRGRP